MLGRKQSLRGDLLPYEPPSEETNNESAGVDWINKVGLKIFNIQVILLHLI